MNLVNSAAFRYSILMLVYTAGSSPEPILGHSSMQATSKGRRGESSNWQMLTTAVTASLPWQE